MFPAFIRLLQWIQLHNLKLKITFPSLSLLPIASVCGSCIQWIQRRSRCIRLHQTSAFRLISPANLIFNISLTDPLGSALSLPLPLSLSCSLCFCCHIDSTLLDSTRRSSSQQHRSPRFPSLARGILSSSLCRDSVNRINLLIKNHLC